MTTPQYSRNFVSEIQRRGFQTLTEADFIQLTTTVHSLLPRYYEKGKKCYNCSHKMPPACKNCPNCLFSQIKKPRVPTPPCENECDGSCARDISNERAIILPCNHKYCVKCLTTWVVTMEFITCCSCRDVRIPEEIINELKHNE